MAPQSAKPHLLYIDCVRGYAVLLVILCHLAYQFPQLPYPVHRLAVMGWFGVQLFFLASCVTLLMSWHNEVGKYGFPDIPAFFIRRFFRIAPAYYLAAVFYFFLQPPAGGFDFWKAFASFAFINAWRPDWMAATNGSWHVVPGGWSIGVEFSFYFLFPVFAAWTTSLRRAALLFAASLLFGLLANKVAMAEYAGRLSPLEMSNFLFFWFPNQASVFAFGGVLYFVLDRVNRTDNAAVRALRNNATLLAVISAVALAALAYVPLGHYIGDTPLVPGYLAVCVPLAALVLVLSTNNTIFVNPYVGAMGKVSFSAYLLHFAVLELCGVFPRIFHKLATGSQAVVAFALAFPVVVLITFGASWMTFMLIEQPMIGVGKSRIGLRRRLAASAPGPGAP